MTALRTTNLAKRYRRGWALRDCTLDLPPGSVTALVGPNGAGKTTLLRLFDADPRGSASVIEAKHSDRHTTLLVRDMEAPLMPGWQASRVGAGGADPRLPAPSRGPGGGGMTEHLCEGIIKQSRPGQGGSPRSGDPA